MTRRGRSWMLTVLLAALTVPGAATADVRELVVPGVYGTVTTAAGPDRALWSLRHSPPRLTRYDGQRSRTFALGPADVPVPDGSPLAVGRDAVYTSVGGDLVRLRPSTGAIRRWPLGRRAPQSIAVAADGRAWLLGRDGRTARLEPDDTLTVFRAPTELRYVRSPLLQGPDGAMWFGTGLRDTFGRVDRLGRARLVRLPGSGVGTLIRFGDRLLVAAGLDGRLRAYRGRRLVARRAAPTLLTTGVDARGRLHAVTLDGRLVRVGRDLRLRRVAGAAAGGAGGPLLAGPGGRLWTAAEGGLARYVPHPTPGLGARRTCIPSGALVVAAKGNTSVSRRSVAEADGDTVDTWYGCASAGARPVVLLRAEQQFQVSETYLVDWVITGSFAAARLGHMTSHYGDGTLYLGVYDLTGRDRGREVLISATGYSVPTVVDLGAFALASDGTAIYVTDDQRTTPVLRLGRPDGSTAVLASAERLEQLRVSTTTASWTQDGVPRSVSLSAVPRRAAGPARSAAAAGRG